jgi:hypothetical protein
MQNEFNAQACMISRIEYRFARLKEFRSFRAPLVTIVGKKNRITLKNSQEGIFCFTQYLAENIEIDATFCAEHESGFEW